MNLVTAVRVCPLVILIAYIVTSLVEITFFSGRKRSNYIVGRVYVCGGGLERNIVAISMWVFVSVTQENFSYTYRL